MEHLTQKIDKVIEKEKEEISLYSIEGWGSDFEVKILSDSEYDLKRIPNQNDLVEAVHYLNFITAQF